MHLSPVLTGCAEQAAPFCRAGVSASKMFPSVQLLPALFPHLRKNPAQINRLPRKDWQLLLFSPRQEHHSCTFLSFALHPLGNKKPLCHELDGEDVPHTSAVRCLEGRDLWLPPGALFCSSQILIFCYIRRCW